MSYNYYFKPPAYNALGRQQLWIDGCINSHDTWCGCDKPLAHLLGALLPPGHKDRDLTVQEILLRDLEYPPCPSGGLEGAAGTQAAAATPQDTEENTNLEDLEKYFTEDAIGDLLNAAAADEEPR